MSNGQLHSIRLKQGDVEFELTSTAEAVADARELLAPTITAAFSGTASEAEAEAGDDGETGSTRPKPRKRSTARRSPAGQDGKADERAELRKKLLGASVQGFPKIGETPSSLLAAYALLSWALSKLQIDGLTAQEIKAFYESKWRMKRTYQAYSQAMVARVKHAEVDVTGTSPKVYRLMRDGETKLLELLAEAAADPK